MKIKIEKLMYANDTKYTISIFVYRRSAVIDDIVMCAILLYQNNCQVFFIDYKIHHTEMEVF